MSIKPPPKYMRKKTKKKIIFSHFMYASRWNIVSEREREWKWVVFEFVKRNTVFRFDNDVQI